MITAESNTPGQPAEQLRSWYLARLRKLAQEDVEAFYLTPAALVVADNQTLQRLITTKASVSGAPHRHAVQSGNSLFVLKRPIAVALWVVLIICMAWLSFQLLTVREFTACIPGFLMICAAALLAISEDRASRRLEYVVHKLQVLHSDNDCGATSTVSPTQLATDENARMLADLSSTLEFLHERERLIADFSPLVVALVDENLKFTAISPSINKLWRILPVELLGKTLPEISSPPDRAKINKALAEAQQSMREVRVEGRVEARNRPTLEIRWCIEWSRTARAYFVAAEDITREKYWQRMRELFLAVVGHDLRSPLVSLKYAIEKLAEDYVPKMDEEGSTLVRAMGNTTEHLIRVVSDLVDINKIETAGIELDVQPIELPILIAQAVQTVSGLAEQRRIKIEQKAPAVVLNLDASRLIRVLVNLLSNAAKFSKEGSTVTIDATMNGDELTLAVKDEGRGIAPGDLPKLFDRFTQLEVEDATLKGGSGLGLSICKDFVGAHGGSIWAESQLGVGTTFFIKIPDALQA